MILFVIFVIIPLIEISLFVKVGGAIGLFNTLFLCLLTAMAGGALIRWQGLNTLLSARTSMNRGEMPVEAMFDGICIAVAGALLLTPGFFTDAIGFTLLVPPARVWLRKRLARHFDMEMGESQVFTQESGVIEAEYERLDEQDKP